MKPTSLFLISFFITLLIFQATSRLPPSSYQDYNKKIEVNGFVHSVSTQVEEDFTYLMGLEECEDKDEGCLKRRMVADAHLDYIYTQNKPKP